MKHRIGVNVIAYYNFPDSTLPVTHEDNQPLTYYCKLTPTKIEPKEEQKKWKKKQVRAGWKKRKYLNKEFSFMRRK